MTYEEAYNVIKRLKLHSSLEKEAEFEEAKNLALRALNNGQRVFVETVTLGVCSRFDEERYQEKKANLSLLLINDLERKGLCRITVNKVPNDAYFLMTGEVRI